MMVYVAIPIVEFSNGGYKIRKIFAQESALTASCQKVPQFDFQSQFSMSKIIRIFLNFFFLKIELM